MKNARIEPELVLVVDDDPRIRQISAEWVRSRPPIGAGSSTARSAQFGSTRLLVPRLTPLRLKSLCSSASSVSSPGNGQLNPTAAARCRLSCTVLRAIPNTTAISRELVPLPASRSICRNFLRQLAQENPGLFVHWRAFGTNTFA